MIKKAHASEIRLTWNGKHKETKKRVETQLTRTKKLIDPIWRARCEDHSHGLRSSIKRTEDKNL